MVFEDAHWVDPTSRELLDLTVERGRSLPVLEIAGKIEEALTLLDDALQIVETTGERWFAAELHRHKGELLLWQGHPEAAAELYRKALSIAKEQEAKLWELRAAASLARLRRDPGPPRRSPRPARSGI
jgi:tetratricopeptide (TPR) repeat protein